MAINKVKTLGEMFSSFIKFCQLIPSSQLMYGDHGLKNMYVDIASNFKRGTF